jgi:hypothetical protein
MAKHCTVCNQDYADDLAACPHCASAKTTHLAGRGEDRTTQLVNRGEERTTQLGDLGEARGGAGASPSESAIDLGSPPISKPAAGAGPSESVIDLGSLAAGAGLSESVIDLGSPPAGAGPSESVIDLGSPPTSKPATGDAGGAGPASDSSIVAWASLVEEPPSEQGQEIKIDSPSDADLLSQGTTEPAPAVPDEELVGELADEQPAPAMPDAGAEAEVVELSDSPPQPVERPSDSAVDLGGLPVELVADESGMVVKETASGESEVFMAELASDASQVNLVSDSGLDLSEGEGVEVAAEDAEAVDAGEDAETPAAESAEDDVLHVETASIESSAVDLGATPVESSEVLAAEEADEVVEVAAGSGIDLEGLPVPGASGSAHPGSESEVDLGSHAEIAAPSPSKEGVEAVSESGIDFGKLGEPAAGEAASDLALEALMSDSASGERIAEEPVAAEETSVAGDEGVVAAEGAVSEEAAVAGMEEPAVSEKEVDDLLAGLEETPAASESGVAVGETVEAAAEEEAAGAEAEEKPAKPVKQRSRIPALVGGTFLGMLIGAGGMFGVQSLTGRGEKEKAPVPQVSAVQTKAPPTLESLVSRVANGDWDEAKAGIEQLSGNDAKTAFVRGDYHLQTILKNVGSKINPQDPALQPALQDLQKAAETNDAAAADATYELAFIKEVAGQLPEARAEYVKGAQKFANDPVQKQRFETAVHRVDLKASAKAGGAAMIPLPQRAEDRAILLALLLIGLQQPSGQPSQPPGQAGQPPAQAEDKEAGFEFWQAAKLAHEGKFSDAIRALDQARKLHDQRRFTRLRKAQNPLSDPAEDIFLRCCDELKVYWQLENRFRDGGYLTDKNTPPEALQALVQKAEASAAAAKDLTDKLAAAKVIGKDDDVSKGLDRLITDKKKADDTVADLTTKLQKATEENTKLAGDLKTAEKTIKEHDADLTSAKEQNTKLKSANDELNATLTKIRDELAKAKFLDPKDRPNVGEAVKRVVDVAKIKDAQGMIRRQRDAIAQLSASLKERWQPEEMLPLWLLLLDENRNRTELASRAMKDAERVKMDPRATAVQKGEAEIVRGLALRNAEKFSEAKAVLEATRGTVDEGEWVARANAALKEVSNPAAYFTSQAQALYDHGRMDAALAVLERAMKVLPAKEQGKLLAQRSLIELDAARSKAKGVLPPNDPLLIAARKDADEAIKAGLAEGHYAAGRIAEELGQVDVAIQSYRKALAAHGDKLDAEGARYRMALARALLLPREARPGQPAMTPPRVGAASRAAPAGSGSVRRTYSARHFEEMKRLVLMLTLGLQAPLLPGEEPGQEEAEKLADEVLKAPPGTVPFNVLAQALAVKGRWNAALQTYVEGIRPMLPREYGNGLAYLIRNDPRLKRPDSLRTPNPLEAEKHFAAGLNFYFDRDYANAEKSFLLAVENDSQDARFFYFLGLSRLAQNRRRDAYADFDEGAKLEHLNRPAPSAVSESLERIQGPMRRTINEFRQRPEQPSGRSER